MKTCSEKALEWNVTPRTVNSGSSKRKKNLVNS